MDFWWDSMQIVGVFWICTLIWSGIIGGLTCLVLELFFQWFTKNSERKV